MARCDCDAWGLRRGRWNETSRYAVWELYEGERDGDDDGGHGGCVCVCYACQSVSSLTMKLAFVSFPPSQNFLNCLSNNNWPRDSRSGAYPLRGPFGGPELTPASDSSFFTPPAWRSREFTVLAACIQACGNTFITDSRFSLAPLGEPGRVRIKVRSRVPATGRDIMATTVFS